MKKTANRHIDKLIKSPYTNVDNNGNVTSIKETNSSNQVNVTQQTFNNKNELIYSATYNTAKTQEEVEILGSNLIVYAGIKGKDLDTTFKYSQIYLNPQQN